MTYKQRKTLSARAVTAGALSILAAAGMTILGAAAANAADLPRREEAPAPAPVVQAPPIFTWTGFYAGANAGWAGAMSHNPAFTVLPAGTVFGGLGKLNSGGVAAGVQAGYNWQTGPLVFGVEADIQYTGLHSRLGPVALGGGAVSASDRVNWYGTLRPRIGYAFGRTLVYATGGLAYGKPEYRLSAVDGAGNFFALRDAKLRTGWTAGAGVEHALNNNWSVKLEYGYVDLGKNKSSAPIFTAAGVPTGAFAASKSDARFHTIRAGVNYKF
ncbi:MAG: outer membrane protein [Beijerinckiaceae bacterium]